MPVSYHDRRERPDQGVDTATGAKITEITQDTNGAVSFGTEKGHTYQVIPGEEQSLLPMKNYISKVKDSGIVPYAYTTETGDEFEKALLVCERMVEQNNYVTSDVKKTLQKLKDAVAALTRRDGEAYATAAALQFLENAAAVNYAGTETEDQWRQSVEYNRADLLEEFKYGSRDRAEVLEEAERLSETGNAIAGYPAVRNNLFDAIKKAVMVSRNEFTEDEWAAYMDAIDSIADIYADVRATEKDLETARIQLMEVIANSKSAFTITVETEGSGSVTPSGKVTVIGGANQQFTMRPEENAQVLDVLVDGKSVGAVSSYTMGNVEKDSTLHVIFQTVKLAKTEEEYLLNNALARAELLDQGDYTTKSWKAMQGALENARSADREDLQDVRAKAEALLDAMDELVFWGEAARVEAEIAGLYPVEDYENSSVYKNEENWGEKDFTEDGSEFRFTGNRVRYITEIARDGAGVDVYIDGEKITELDCFTNKASIYERNYVAFDSAGYDLILEDGAHVLKLVGCLDEKNTTAKNCIFRVDAFDSYPDTVKTVSTKALASQVAKVSALSSIGVTKDSWNNLQDKLESAGAILQDANATEEAVSAALTELQSAESSLVPTDIIIKYAPTKNLQ